RTLPGAGAEGDAILCESSEDERLLVLRRKRESTLGRQLPHGVRAGLLQTLQYVDGRQALRRQDDEGIRVLEEDVFPTGRHAEILRLQGAAARHSVLFSGD